MNDDMKHLIGYGHLLQIQTFGTLISEASVRVGSMLNMVPGSKYDWHVDVGPNNNHRKLSLTIQLSDPQRTMREEYFILKDKLGDSKFMKKGATIMSPHYRHKVTSVVKGMRKSLVIWVSGPRLK